jgi:hypothetical protein
MTVELRVISVATCAECPFHIERPFACVCAWGEEEADVRIVEDRDNQPEWCPLEKTNVLFTTRIHAVIRDLEHHNAVQISGPGDETPDPDEGYEPGVSEATAALKKIFCHFVASGVRKEPLTFYYNDEIIECWDVCTLVDRLLEVAEIEWCSYSPRDDGEWVFDMPNWCEEMLSLLDTLPLVTNFFDEIKWDIRGVLEMGGPAPVEKKHENKK